MRTLASEVGTSNRMINYHFGSREDLLAAVVEEVERAERHQLETLLASVDDPWQAGLEFWQHVADRAESFAALYFELAGQAMQGHEHAAGLRSWLQQGWAKALQGLFAAAGQSEEHAGRTARQALAMARALLFELAHTGDRLAADRAMTDVVALLRAADTA